jgi:hypothetical protein
MSCRLVCIGGTYCLHLHGREVSRGKVAWLQENGTAGLEVRSRPFEGNCGPCKGRFCQKMAVSEQWVAYMYIGWERTNQTSTPTPEFLQRYNI